MFTLYFKKGVQITYFWECSINNYYIIHRPPRSLYLLLHVGKSLISLGYKISWGNQIHVFINWGLALEDAGMEAQAEEKRNAIMHSYWGADALWTKDSEKKKIVTRIKPTAKRTQGLKHHWQDMSVQDLDEIADFIAEVEGDVRKFF